MNLGIVFFVKGKVLNRFHDIGLPHVNHGLDIIHETLMLYLSCILYSLFDLNWVLVDLSPQFSGHFDFNMSLSYVILENQEHGFVAVKEDLVLMRVEVFR
jgi:hypothetical protein